MGGFGADLCEERYCCGGVGGLSPEQGLVQGTHTRRSAVSSYTGVLPSKARG